MPCQGVDSADHLRSGVFHKLGLSEMLNYISSAQADDGLGCQLLCLIWKSVEVKAITISYVYLLAVAERKEYCRYDGL